MKNIFISLLILMSSLTQAQTKNENEIKQVLLEQTLAWNNGNLEAFMQAYWNDDRLMFVGKSGVTYGWQNTLNNYKKSYSDTSIMGKLSFDLLKFSQIKNDNYYVVGKWFLKRTVGDIGGHFTLWLKKMSGKWKIVADHSS